MATPTVITEHGIKPDALTVTFSAAHDAAVLEIKSILTEGGFSFDFWSADRNTQTFRSPTGFGTCRLSANERYVTVSITGRAIDSLLMTGHMAAYIAVLCWLPGIKVTRLDLCQDIYYPSVEMLAQRLSELTHDAKRGLLALSRKRVPYDHVRRLMTYREPSVGASPVESVETGTLEIGRRSNTVYAKVYDKRAEIAHTENRDLGEERLRVEVSANRGRATLKDFVEPDALFFAIASPALLPRPRGVATWSKTEMDPRTLPPIEKKTDAQRMQDILDGCHALDVLAVMVEKNPKLRPLLERRLEVKLRERHVAA